MNFKELLLEVDFSEVEECIIKNYPEEKNNVQKGNFRKAYNILLEIEPALNENDRTLVITKEKDFPNEIQSYVCFYIKDNQPKPYALDYLVWDKVLSSHIIGNDLKEVGKEEYVSHILWEITYNGFGEKNTKQALNEIQNRINLIKDKD